MAQTHLLSFAAKQHGVDDIHALYRGGQVAQTNRGSVEPIQVSLSMHNRPWSCDPIRTFDPYEFPFYKKSGPQPRMEPGDVVIIQVNNGHGYARDILCYSACL